MSTTSAFSKGTEHRTQIGHNGRDDNACQRLPTDAREYLSVPWSPQLESQCGAEQGICKRESTLFESRRLPCIERCCYAPQSGSSLNRLPDRRGVALGPRSADDIGDVDAETR